MNSITYREYLAPCCEIARQAGQLIMGYWSGEFTTSHKEDKSPVTDADLAANRLITERLSALTPGISVVAEEDKTIPDARHAMFWLVDPLDGTRAFVRRDKDFSVNIGLVKDGLPVLGIIYAPAEDALYWGAENLGAFRSVNKAAPEKISARVPGDDGLVVVRSQSHPSPQTTAYLETLAIKKNIGLSSAIKFCLLAEGKADLYPRFGRTMEWDTAAGHAILNAAGGRVTTIDGKPFLYGKPGFENPAFIAYGKRT